MKGKTLTNPPLTKKEMFPISGENIQPIPPSISYWNPEAVQAFLALHPKINDFIKAAWPSLVKCFGEPVDIVLEVMRYPEAGAYDELVGWIQSTAEVETGLEKLAQFEDEWFLDHLAEIGNIFNFNIEFK